MEKALVVYDEAGTELLTEAGELAAGVDASVVVLALMTEDEFDEAREALDIVAAEEGTAYDDSVVVDSARNQARDAVSDLYDDLGLDWRVVGAVVEDEGEAAERIVDVAEKRGADHVFLTGRRRSPTGKAVFGDRAQAVILNFDGPVTTVAE